MFPLKNVARKGLIYSSGLFHCYWGNQSHDCCIASGVTLKDMGKLEQNKTLKSPKPYAYFVGYTVYHDFWCNKYVPGSQKLLWAGCGGMSWMLSTFTMSTH